MQKGLNTRRLCWLAALILGVLMALVFLYIVPADPPPLIYEQF